MHLTQESSTSSQYTITQSCVAHRLTVSSPPSQPDHTPTRVGVPCVPPHSTYLPRSMNTHSLCTQNPLHSPASVQITLAGSQCFMQDENVACHDLGKLSFERAVGCFGKPQLERATRFPMPQLERATRFPMSQLELATRFPNVPSRACNSLLNCQFEVCVFDCFCHSMPFICLNISCINYIN